MLLGTAIVQDEAEIGGNTILNGNDRVGGNTKMLVPPECVVVPAEPRTRNISIRRLLLPRDTNHRGEIFGGAILAEIDLAGAIEARRHTQHDVATMAVKEVVFKSPVQVGDVVTFWTYLIRTGKTSISVGVEVESSRDGNTVPVSVTAAEVVYVAIERDAATGLTHKVPVV